MVASSAGINTYINNHYEGMSPEKLILMLFDGALERLNKTKEGIKENDVQKKGENLSKTVAIIAELYSSLNPELNDEATEFLRGLYFSILTELSKVSTTNDVEILDKTTRYISKLREIWVNEVIPNQQTHNKPPAENHNTSRIRSISV